jgi:serine phosphatase RsbU (regulator of sigma subunit)
MEFGFSARPANGETVCGDAYRLIVAPGRWLLCVADGLGHGPAAEIAASAACNHCESHATDRLESLFVSLESALATSRGAAVSILDFDPTSGRVRFAGVGNVELRSSGTKRFAPLTTAGIVGRRPRAPIVSEERLASGDLLVMFTDGVSSRFELQAYAQLSAQAAADEIVAKHQKSHDDSLCVALRVPVIVTR